MKFNLLRIILESSRQAYHQLVSNKMRSFLSLLGITIGIFCIIAVKSAVDSLENDIRQSFDKLGDNVAYVQQMPWADMGDNYWKYIKRPMPDFDDFKALDSRVKTVEYTAFMKFLGGKTVKFLSNDISNAFTIAVTPDYGNIFNMEMEDGRFFSDFEYSNASDVGILGFETAELLFGNISPVGKMVKMNGRKIKIVGVIKQSGQSLIDPVNFDEVFIIPYTSASKYIDIRSERYFSYVAMKAKPEVTFTDMKDDITYVLRAEHRLKPLEEDDFAINELAMVSEALDGLFGVLNTIGILIGIFALLVGMFSVANIMFVSVKERTNIIGIKKALGAKRSMILMEFLIESMILCLIGGALGILMVLGVTMIINSLIDFTISMSFLNLFWGVMISIIVGVIAGVIPALQGSRLDPVEAIRK